MHRPTRIARRRFVRSLGAAAVGVSCAAIGRGAESSDKLRIALIGAGGRGSYIALEAQRLGGSIVAMCDVDAAQLAASQKLFAQQGVGGAATAGRIGLCDDYRKLLDHAGSFDAVMIATGSRWHAPLSLALMKAGKHVYCEKPMAYRVAEARQLGDEARRGKVVTQLGTQGASSKACRRAIENVQAGLLGQVRSVVLWSNGYAATPPSQSRPAGEDPVPAGFNWDFWLGPAPMRPFKKGVYHPGCLAFQNWLDLCNGLLSGQGAHTFDLPYRALALDWPVRIASEPSERILETYPARARVQFDFAARGTLDPLTVWWYDGGWYPPEDVTANLKAASGKVPAFGILLIGEKGELFAGGWGEDGRMKLAGDKQWRSVLNHEAAKSLPVTLPRAPEDNHVLEWVRACKGGPKTFTGFDVGGAIAEVYLAGIVSLRLGKTVDWDGKAMKVPGLSEAEPLIRHDYRRKWLT